ncbi:MAG TPA: hypothetical protein VLV15_07730, partial [Dongiaceae bacterium]|nr:hypothetical protein [Dongiaceae bacterium]
MRHQPSGAPPEQRIRRAPVDDGGAATARERERTVGHDVPRAPRVGEHQPVDAVGIRAAGLPPGAHGQRALFVFAAGRAGFQRGLMRHRC